MLGSNETSLDYRSAINTTWVVVSTAITFLMVLKINQIYTHNIILIQIIYLFEQLHLKILLKFLLKV